MFIGEGRLHSIVTRLLNALPGATLFQRYDRSCLRHDALAALVVTLVLLPSAIAYADLARCAPAAGLYAAVAGMVAFALFTSSRHVIVGPDAAIALLVGAAIGPLAAGDPGKAVALAAVLALLTAGFCCSWPSCTWASRPIFSPARRCTAF